MKFFACILDTFYNLLRCALCSVLFMGCVAQRSHTELRFHGFKSRHAAKNGIKSNRRRSEPPSNKTLKNFKISIADPPGLGSNFLRKKTVVFKQDTHKKYLHSESCLFSRSSYKKFRG